MPDIHAVPTGPTLNEVFTVLLVCTGNICRSAMAERLGRAHLVDLLGERSSAIRLVSAGTRAVTDSPMHPDSAQVLREFGGDSSAFVARQLIEPMTRHADLTLAMTREHRRECLLTAPRALRRTFTLREAADLARLVGDGTALPGETVPERARSLVMEMARARSRRVGGEDDDVPDPIGRPLTVHRQAGEWIADALLPLLSQIAGTGAAQQW